MPEQPVTEARQPRSIFVLVAVVLIVCAVAVGVVTFATHVVAPRLLTHYDRFPALATVPKRTVNAKGVAGDPINVAIVGSDSEIVRAFLRAGWTIPQPVNRATSIGIAKSVLLDQPDSAAPVSPLYLFGRQQDLAFELEVGRSARRRHHVRLWRVAAVSFGGRPVWIGGATFDLRAGISHRGLHPTHHIAPDIDQERDTLTAALLRAGQVAARFHVTGLGVRVDARNAEGDRFDTDGEMQVLVIPANNVPARAPDELPDPPLVRLKNALWNWGHRVRGTRADGQ